MRVFTIYTYIYIYFRTSDPEKRRAIKEKTDLLKFFIFNNILSSIAWFLTSFYCNIIKLISTKAIDHCSKKANICIEILPKKIKMILIKIKIRSNIVFF